jgi:SAM-dependent methyltransferase
VALAHVLANPLVYRLWQAPWAARKLEPVCRHNDLHHAGRVLDVGCGPGTNARHFPPAGYVGVDLNPRYLRYALRRWGGAFVAADAATGMPLRAARFDFILVNSFFHHLDLASTRRVLAELSGLLSDGGHVHILELALPDAPGMARAMARWDRGAFARPLTEWQTIFTETFAPVVVEPYRLGSLGVTLWNMVYFKGRRKP